MFGVSRVGPVPISQRSKRRRQRAFRMSDLIRPGYQLPGRSVKIVARLVAGGLKTSCTWSASAGLIPIQVRRKTATLHPEPMRTSASAIGNDPGIPDRFRVLNIEDRSEMTHSVDVASKSNASFRTDQRAPQRVLVFGKRCKAASWGASPTSPDQAGSNNNLPMQYDFRSVYASILQDWLKISTDPQTILFSTTRRYRSSSRRPAMASHELNQAAGLQLITIHPIPSRPVPTSRTPRKAVIPAQCFRQSKLIKNLWWMEQSAGFSKVWFENGISRRVFYAVCRMAPSPRVAKHVSSL